MSDAWRMALGTLTTVRVPAPAEVTARVAGTAMLLAPAAGLVLGVLAGAVFWASSSLGLGSFTAAVLAIGVLRLGDRGFHLDGLADTADGLAASYDRERALAVMRTGDTGPAGSTALVLVLLTQVAGAARLGDMDPLAAAVGVGGCVVVSRSMLMVGCLRGVTAARPDGLGAVVAGSVRRASALGALVVVAGILTLAGNAAGTGSWWAWPAVVMVSVGAAGVVVWRCVQRFGGVTGDVLGAVVEVSLAAAVVVLAAAV